MGVSGTYVHYQKHLTLINSYRTKKGLSEFVHHATLCPLAQKRLEELHTEWTQKEMDKANCIGSCAENVGRGFTDEQSQLTAWLNSPTNGKNLYASREALRSVVK